MVREYTKIQFRRDNSGNWTTVNPVLLAGEIGYETDTQKFKIGTGSLAWNQLSYAIRPYVGDGLNITEDGVVYADINQSDFDDLKTALEQTDSDLLDRVNTIDGPDTLDGSFRRGDDVIQQQVTRIDGPFNLAGSFREGDEAIRQRVDIIDGDISEPGSFRAGDEVLKLRLDAVQGDVNTDGSILNAVNVERDDRIQADQDIQDQIDIIDGTGADSFRKAVADEEFRAMQKELELENSIAVINGSGEGSIEDAVLQETNDRIDSDNNLQLQINAINANDLTPTSFRYGDRIIQEQVDVIDEADNFAGSFRHEVKTKVDAEATARQNADVTLQNNITTEANTRALDDEALSNRIDALELDPTSKEYVDDADAVLQGQIDDMNDAVSGKADLVGGKIPNDQIPDLAISQYLGEAANETAMLLLQGDSGDWCFRTDVSASYIAIGSDLTLPTNWKSITGAETGVVTVNGRYGEVLVTKDEFDVDHLETLSGMPPQSDNLGTFAGSTIPDGSTVKVALQALESEVELKAVESHVDNLTGIDASQDDLGSFVGTTIPANSNIKNALQSLQTSLETKEASANLKQVAYTADYNDLELNVPTAVSDFTNDLNFIDKAGSAVTSVAGREGAVVLTKVDVGLDNVENTTDLAKPISVATQDALDLKYNSSQISTFGASLIDDADAAAARLTLGVDVANTDNSTNVTVAAGYDYLSISGSSQVITLGQIDLTTDVIGTLPLLNGGTGATDAAGARANLGVDPAGTDNSKPVSLTGAGTYISLTNTGTNQQLALSFIDLSSQVSGILPVSNGGTGAATEPEARAALGLGSAAVEDATATGILLMNAADAAAGRTVLGVDAAGTDNSTDVTLNRANADYLSIVDQTISLAQIDLTSNVSGVLPVANGGTGATDAAAARSALGLGSAATTDSGDYATAAQGTAADAALPAASVSAFGLTLIDDTDAATARGTLGLGTAATTDATDYATAAQGTAADNALDSSAVSAYGLTLIDDVDAAAARGTLGLGTAAVEDATTTGVALITAADAAAVRTSIGVDAAGTDNSTDVTIAAGLDYVTLSGQQLTLGSVDLTTDVTGTLPPSNGGTGVTNVADLPVSTATQSALDDKAPLASPTFTGVPAAPTASIGTNTTQIATTEFVTSAVDALDGIALRNLLGFVQATDDAAAGSAGVASGAVYWNTTDGNYQVKS